MSTPEAELRRAWVGTFGRSAAVDASLDALLARLREPHRRYHTAVHVVWVIRHLRSLTAAPAPELMAAALYHDAIYDPLSSSNEAESAALADAALQRAGWDRSRRQIVGGLIVATASHDVVADDAPQPMTNQLLDADMAILGADPAAYAAYVTGIRAEYQMVTDQQWRVGRTAVLQRFAAMPAIFRTEAMCAAREHRARANIASELTGLENLRVESAD